MSLAKNSRKFICSCYFTKNIFLNQYNLHVKFNETDEEFWDNYGEVLKNNGCKSDEDRCNVLKLVHSEIERRKANGRQSFLRKKEIKERYQPLHPQLYNLKESYLHEDFKNVVNYCRKTSATKDELIKKISVCQAEEVYSLPVFTLDFCKQFLEELQHFQESDLPKGRPNTMNKSGILLEEIGFYENFVDPLRCEYLEPIARLLYPDWCGESGLDSQRAFIVNYNYEKDGDNSDLNIHFDNAEVTLNVSLNDDFEGGELFLAGMRKEVTAPFKKILHEPSHGILHRSQQLHGAMPLEDGERYNLIIWMRSSTLRNTLCPRCDMAPILVNTEGEADGFSLDDKTG